MNVWTEPSARARGLLEISQWPGVGPAKVRKIARAIGNESDDILSFAATFVPQIGIGEREMAIRSAEKIIADCRERQIAILSLCDDLYPSRLGIIDDAPALIYVRGTIGALHKPTVAVVGTRHASSAGLRAASVIATYLAKNSYCVVSGLALGIDAAAHRGAIDARGTTIAVMAHGLHTVAPTTNQNIAEQLLEHGGALVSEHPPGIPPHRGEFVTRNRILSGLSMCSIVVESGETGGAIHQATFTKQQGRALFTVVADERTGMRDLNESGARVLISKFGAIPIRGTAQLGAELRKVSGSPSGPTDISLQGTLFDTSIIV